MWNRASLIDDQVPCVLLISCSEPSSLYFDQIAVAISPKASRVVFKYSDFVVETLAIDDPDQPTTVIIIDAIEWSSDTVGILNVILNCCQTKPLLVTLFNVSPVLFENITKEFGNEAIFRALFYQRCIGTERNYFDHKICRSVLKKYTSKFIFGSHVPYADWVIINLIYYLIQHEDFLSLQHPASVICAKLLGKYKETLREFYAESAFLNFFSILCKKNKVSNN